MIKRERGRKRDIKRDKKREIERERGGDKERERERENCPELLLLFVKGGTGALASFSYLVIF
jgi:hypothetical protein